VLATAPDDPEANRALGQVSVGGRWMTEEESYRTRGYVELEDELMTPAERDVLLRERAAEADRRQVASEARAREAEASAREAEARAAEAVAAEQPQDGIPLWWGWGPGPVGWPSPPVSRPSRPVARPRN
jgi:hypothetical protein